MNEERETVCPCFDSTPYSEICLILYQSPSNFYDIYVMTVETRDDEWDEVERSNWRGLGLTDPIKNVEVSTKCVRFLVLILSHRRL